MNVLRVAITSDQPIYMRGLAAMLMQMKDIELIGEATCSSETLQLCQIAQPDALVIDGRNAGEEHRSLVGQVREGWPGTRIVLLMEEGHPNLVEWEQANVFCFSRDISETELAVALDEVRRYQRRAEFKPAAQPETLPESELDAGEVDELRLIYNSALVRERQLVNSELAMAGKIQADILPEEPPAIPGYELTAALLPAHETSGDFYDFIPIGPRKWGVLAADVSDKGMGAALLMALASTLLRTYTVQFPTLPAVTLQTVSERILSDTRGGMFVTALLVILEPHTGRLVYANGGHPPGLLISQRRGRDEIERLRPTGMAMGVDGQSRWRQRDVRLEPGDLLVMYTDGITEARREDDRYFGEERLLEVALANRRAPVKDIQAALLNAVRDFAGSPQDDIALIVMRRI